MIHNGWVAPYGTQAERSGGARIFRGRDVDRYEHVWVMRRQDPLA